MTGDDNFLSSLDAIQESAERILGLKGSDLFHAFLPYSLA